MKHIYTAVFRHILLLSILLSIGRQNAQAQVKIGTSNENINQGASLEVESGPYPGNVFRGFLLPRVALTDYGTWSLAGTPTDGMVVFNSATTTGTYPVTPGIYCWYNFQWNRQSPEITTKVAQIASVDCQPGVPVTGAFDVSLNLTGSSPYLHQAKQISVVPATSGTYRFYSSQTNGYYFSGSGTFTPAQVGTPQTVNLQASGTVGTTGIDSFTVLNVNNNYAPICSFTVSPTNAADCGGPLSGIYKVNTPFDASNTKQITFTPPLAGEYTFYAAVNYGIRISTTDFTFTKSVIFSDDQVAKPQLVTLVEGSANGAPTVSGTYISYVKVDGPFYHQDTPISPPTGIAYGNICYFNVTVTP